MTVSPSASPPAARSGPATPAATENEASLVVRAQRGERDAIERILADHLDRIERLARTIVKNPMDAEEVTQDVLIAVTAKINRFRGDSALSTWIHRIAVNTALMHRRRHQPGRLVHLDEAGPADAEATVSGPVEYPVDPALRGEFWDVVWQAVDGLEDKYRTAFVLRAVEGLSTEEAARRLGLKVPALKSRLHRARVALRARLSRYFESDALGLAALGALAGSA